MQINAFICAIWSVLPYLQLGVSGKGGGLGQNNFKFISKIGFLIKKVGGRIG